MIYLLWGGVFIFASVSFFWLAKRLGTEEEKVAEARKEAEHAKTSGKIIAEHRTADDAAKRLQDGTF